MGMWVPNDGTKQKDTGCSVARRKELINMNDLWRVNFVRKNGKKSWYIYRLRDPKALDIMKNREILPGIRFKEEQAAKNSAAEMNRKDGMK